MATQELGESYVKMGERQQLYKNLLDELKAMDQIEELEVPSDGGFMDNNNDRSKIGAKNVITKLNYNIVYKKEKAGKAQEFEKVGNNAMINAERQLYESELQIKLEQIMLERSMERMSRKSELESELTSNNNMFDEVKFEDPSDDIEVIFHNGVPIVMISKVGVMKLIAAQRQNFGMQATRQDQLRQHQGEGGQGQ